MSRINAHRPTTAAGGFSVIELMVATSLSAIIFAGILTACLFLGRNLTRLVNSQEQEVRSRHALRVFTRDIGAGIPQTSPAPTTAQIVVAMPLPLPYPKSPTITSDMVTYAYSSGKATLTRTEVIVDPSAVPSTVTTTTTLLSGLTGAAGDGFVYYNESGTPVTSSLQSVKSVEFTFTSAVGSTTSGTLATAKTVSPRVLLRNKALLQ